MPSTLPAKRYRRCSLRLRISFAPSSLTKKHTDQWCASAFGSSASNIFKYSSAPEPTWTCASALLALTALASAPAVGSAASYAESSEARSEGRVGGWGWAGCVKDLTAPTWASLGYGQREREVRGEVSNEETYAWGGFVGLEFLNVELLDKF